MKTVGIRQHHVEQHQIRLFTPEQGEGLGTILAGHRDVPLLGHYFANQHQAALRVFHNQDFHGRWVSLEFSYSNSVPGVK